MSRGTSCATRPGVTGFVGSQGKPVPLSRDEFQRIMKRTEGGPKQKTSTDLVEGQAVKVTSGPLADFDGTISEVNPDAGQGQGHGVHLRPGDSGRARLRPSGEALDTGTTRHRFAAGGCGAVRSFSEQVSCGIENG